MMLLEVRVILSNKNEQKNTIPVYHSDLHTALYRHSVICDFWIFLDASCDSCDQL